MSKTNISATVDENVASYLSRETVNASGLINQLVKKQMSGTDSNKQLLKLRLDQINSEITRYESQIETLEKERDGIKNQLAEIEQKEESELSEAMDVLETVHWEEDNPAIQQWADDLDMSESDLIAQLEDYHAE